jgi:hypothetical protein
VMFEYGSASIDSGLDETTSFTLSSARFGLNLRLMSPGKSARFVGTIGGGATYDTFSFEPGGQCEGDKCGDVLPKCVDGCSGFNAFLLGELGFELDLKGVLVGLAFQSYFQSIKGIDEAPFGKTPVAIIGGGLRVGYALW